MTKPIVPLFTFTDACIKSLTVTGDGYERSDNSAKAVPGLSIRVTPTGKKTYSLLYRNSEGLRRRIKVGDFPTLGVKAAQAKARLMAAESQSKGTDHLAEKQRKRREREQAKASTLIGFLDGEYRCHAEQELRRPAEAIARVNACFPSWLNQPMAAITDLKIRRWMKNARAAGKLDTTIGSDLIRLRGVLSQAVIVGLLDSHPLQATERKRVKMKIPSAVAADVRVRFLTKPERNRLDKALEARDRRIIKERRAGNIHRSQRGKSPLPEIASFGDYLHPLTITALNTGMRRGELLQLTWADVNLQRKQVTVRSITSKTERQRHIPLNKEVLTALKRWQRQSPKTALVFTKHGQPITTPRTAWTTVMKVARIEGFRFHDCRHDFASQLVMSGVDLLTVSKLLGHSTIDTTIRYAHLSSDHLVKAVRELES